MSEVCIRCRARVDLDYDTYEWTCPNGCYAEVLDEQDSPWWAIAASDSRTEAEVIARREVLLARENALREAYAAKDWKRFEELVREACDEATRQPDAG